MRELEGLDLSASFADVESMMQERLRATQMASVESVVAWEIEEELSAFSPESSAVAAKLSSLEAKLERAESWLRAHEDELERLKSGTDQIVEENAAVETQRQGLAKLDEVLSGIVDAAALSSTAEECLLDAGRRLGKGQQKDVLEAVAALQRVEARVKDAPQLRAVEERVEQLAALALAFATGAERYVRKVVEKSARRGEYHNVDSMSKEALRTALRRRQKEIHGTIAKECSGVFQALKDLGKADSLKRSKKALAVVTREIAYGPLFRAYFRALVAQHQEPSAALARAMEDLPPLVLDEQAGAARMFFCDVDFSPLQFSELRACLIGLVETGAVGLEAAAIVAVVEDAAVDLSRAKRDSAFLTQVISTLRQAATRKWTTYVDERRKSIAACEVHRKRDHAAGPSPASTEVARFADKLETIINKHPRHSETKVLLSERLAEPAYDAVTAAFDDWVARAVDADSKYGVVVALENNDYVAGRIAATASGSPALRALAARCHAKTSDATTKYADWMWDYKFHDLDVYYSKLQDAVNRRDAGSSRTKVVSVSHSALEDQINKILIRLEKHFPKDSRIDPNLAARLKAALLDRFRATWSRYDNLSRAAIGKPIEPNLNHMDLVIRNLQS